jgi:hypothetical protein
MSLGWSAFGLISKRNLLTKQSSARQILEMTIKEKITAKQIIIFILPKQQPPLFPDFIAF